MNDQLVTCKARTDNDNRVPAHARKGREAGLRAVVALEVFGHRDPRIIESGEMFVHVVREFAPKLGLADDVDRLVEMIRARIAKG